MNNLMKKVFLGLSAIALTGLAACSSTPEERETAEYRDNYGERAPASTVDSQMYSQGKKDKQYFKDMNKEAVDWEQDETGQAVATTQKNRKGKMLPHRSVNARVTANRSMVKDVQQALNDEGHNLEVDGIMGTKTRNALSSFQGRNGIQANGQLDTRTLEALGLDSDRSPASVNEETETLSTEDYDMSWE